MQWSSFSKAGRLSLIVLLIFSVYSFQTIRRNNDWHDDFSLVSKDVRKAQNNCQVQLHYGVKLVDMAIREQDAVKRKQWFDEGIQHLNTGLQIYPGLTEAYYHKGQAYYKIAGNTDSAIVLYNRAIMENSNYPYSYFGLAELYENTGKQSLASYYYNKAVEANPNLQQMVALRDNHRKRTGLNVNEFPSENNDTVGISEDKDFGFYIQTGKSYGQKGDYVNAIRNLEKAISINPNSEEALINLSVCFGMTKDYTRIIEMLHRALSINPNNTTALTNIAILYNHIGDKESGDKYSKQLKALQQR
jgi:tetratricopeptide (TPR) repeat protein